MGKILTNIQEYLDRRRYNVILQDRRHLTDYEKEQLIPELKLRLEALKKYFNEIIRLCDLQRNSREFTQNLDTIINPRGLPGVLQDGGQSIAERFFDEIKAQAQREGVDDIEKILNRHREIHNTKELGLFLNEVNLLCSSLLAVKNNLFLYKIEGYPFVTNVQTGQTISAQPRQYFLTTEPFQITINNIISVASATSGTIDEWHKYAMNLKSQYLDLYINRLSIKNSRWAFCINLLTVLLAVALSAFFLIANDPFDLYKKNRDLELRNKTLEIENQALRLNTKKSR